MKSLVALAACTATLLGSTTLSVGLQTPPRFTEELLKTTTWRNIGPFRAGGWATDVAVPERPPRAHLYTMYVGTRNGGLWKTTNNGTTWEALFEQQDVASIGAVALAPSNPDIVWAGTGDAYNARSSYYGDGVYKSTDAGATWQNMGLRDSHHIAKIVVHPANPNTVFVAAMGHLWTPNAERGIFKSTDGGRTWTKSLFINERVGIIDLVMNRQNPDVLYAAAYEKERRPWHLEEGGPGSGIYKTIDGGAQWIRLEGGLPEGKIGRIGLDTYQKNPNILYAIVENANNRPTNGDPAQNARPIGGEVYKTEDAGKTWRKTHGADVNVGGKAPYSFNILRVDQNNPQNIFVTSDTLPNSTDGGRTWFDLNWPSTHIFKNMFGDVRNFWIDPEDSNRMILLSDGGVHVSYDGGKTVDHYTNLPLGEVYALDADMDDPYNVYAGLQDHESWKGPNNGRSGSVGLEDWTTVGIGDGMYNRVDRSDSRWVYTTQEFGHLARYDQQARTRTVIEPTRPRTEPALRFNWVAPFTLSPHNSQVIYAGAQVLFRSMDRGDHWQEISPDLTTNDQQKIAQNGPSIRFCTITTISESPVTPGVIWVGTDDGNVQVTRNGGAEWDDRTSTLAAAGSPARWVSRVFASPHDAATAFVARTGYRDDDFQPYVYRTNDYGKTWTSVAGDLPQRPINVVVQDPVKPNLLFVGNDRGVYVSVDGGQHWVAVRGNMATVPVHDLIIHPRENDLIAGTYGRGIWITDMAFLREISDETLGKPLHVFAVEPKSSQSLAALGNYRLYGDRYLRTPNEPTAFDVAYYLKEATDEKAKIALASRSTGCGRTLSPSNGIGSAAGPSRTRRPVTAPASPVVSRTPSTMPFRWT
jgi:photosystem II stability/assembly factor-like uncharacterized protein